MNSTDTAIKNITMTNSASTQAVHSTTQAPEETSIAILATVIVLLAAWFILAFVIVLISLLRKYKRNHGSAAITEPEFDTLQQNQEREIYCEETPNQWDGFFVKSNEYAKVICDREEHILRSLELPDLGSTGKVPSNDLNKDSDQWDDISVGSYQNANVICDREEHILRSLELPDLGSTGKVPSNDLNKDSGFKSGLSGSIFRDSPVRKLVEIPDEVSSELKETIIPLGHPTNKQTDDGNEHNDRSLDWNKILRYLARCIHAQDWQIFFTCLYENTKQLSNIKYVQRIQRVEQDVRAKSGGTEYLLLEQFKSWKEAAGNNASPDVIEETLTELGHMDTLEEFKNYMRDPPYLNSTDVSVDAEADEGRDQSNDISAAEKRTLSTTYVLLPGSKLVKETHSKISLEISQNTVGERFSPDGASVVNFDTTHNADLQTDPKKPSLTSPNEALKALTMLDNSDGQFSNECQVYQFTGVSASENLPKRRNKCRQACIRIKKSHTKHKRKRKASERLSSKSMELLIECYIQTGLEIKPDMHRFSTRKTIDELQKSNIKRDSALCLKYEEYCEIEPKSSKRGDKVYILYIGEEMHVLKSNAYNKLKLYAEHVRAQVIRRLKNMDEDDYMFIDYNGFPLHKKHKDESDDTTSTSSSANSDTIPKIVDETYDDQN